MRRAALAAAVFSGLVGFTSAAGAWTAEELQEACSNGDLYYLYGACAGYLIAVADTLPEGRICLPSTDVVFSVEGAADVVVLLQPITGETAGALAIRALEAAHSC